MRYLCNDLRSDMENPPHACAAVSILIKTLHWYMEVESIRHCSLCCLVCCLFLKKKTTATRVGYVLVWGLNKIHSHQLFSIQLHWILKFGENVAHIIKLVRFLKSTFIEIELVVDTLANGVPPINVDDFLNWNIFNEPHAEPIELWAVF